MLSEERIVEILEAYDLTGSLRSAAQLCGVDHHTVRRYVQARDAGLEPTSPPPVRERVTDPFADKIAEWIDRSQGRIRADRVHDKLGAPVLGTAGMVLVLATVAGTSRPAAAHDPGQGDRRGYAHLTATVDERTVKLDAALSDVDCAGVDDATLVARRAGMTRSAPLTRVQGCRYTGRVALPEGGRWFVYATFKRPDATWETWLPVEVSNGATASDTRVLYEPPASPDRGTEALVGAILVALAAVLLVGSLRALARSSAPG